MRDIPVSEKNTADLLEVPRSSLEGGVSWEAVFGNDHPVEVEIGCGKGRFLILAGLSCPGRNFLGLDYSRKYLDIAIRRAGRRGLTNVRLAHAEAMKVVPGVPDRSVHGYHVYFPDPWPKKRHHKRRLLRRPFLEQAHRTLAPGGRVLVLTDHAGYLMAMREEAEASGLFDWSGVFPDDVVWDDDGLTNFELKYRQEGRPIHRLVLHPRATVADTGSPGD